MTPFQHKQIDLMRQMESRLASDPTASTIVPLQTDYETDPQLCLSVNSFIPETIAKTIQTKLIEPLQSLDSKQYYYPPNALHITFHSIRIIHDPPNFSQQDIEISKDLLSKIVPSQQPFPFSLQGVLSMPTSVSVMALATPEYDQFIRQLRAVFVHAGIPDDKTYFTNEMVFANSTFCRYTHQPSKEFLKKLSEMKNTYIGEIVTGDVSLVETNAGAHPSKTRVFGRYRFKEN